jgi:hypothetical protein
MIISHFATPTLPPDGSRSRGVARPYGWDPMMKKSEISSYDYILLPTTQIGNLHENTGFQAEIIDVPE